LSGRRSYWIALQYAGVATPEIGGLFDFSGLNQQEKEPLLLEIHSWFAPSAQVIRFLLSSAR
jgi:hypothetical protein